MLQYIDEDEFIRLQTLKKTRIKVGKQNEK